HEARALDLAVAPGVAARVVAAIVQIDAHESVQIEAVELGHRANAVAVVIRPQAKLVPTGISRGDRAVSVAVEDREGLESVARPGPVRQPCTRAKELRAAL